MIKAIIFDCFGVLAEDGWMPLKRKHIGDNAVMAQEVADLGKQNEYGMIDNETHLHQMAEIMGIDSEILRKALGVRVPNEELFDFVVKELKPYYKIGLMSNANFDVTKDLFTPNQAAVFDASVMSFESRLIKPDERMFDLMATRLGVRWDECVFVDDQERYCEVAERLGMRGVVYSDNQQCIEDLRAIIATQ
jgi:epoxide hydrolase-like predicted phosphatase